MEEIDALEHASTRNTSEVVMTRLSRIAAAAPSFLLLASSLPAQSFSIGLRGTGGLPTGSFAQAATTSSANNALIAGAKNGFGYGLDVGLGIGPLGVYGGFDQIHFDCATSTCQTDGKYTLHGVTVGAKLAMPLMSQLRPYVKGGVTFNDLQGGYGGSSSNRVTTDKTPGYEVGAGLDYSLAGLVSLTPQLRYIGQNLKAKIPGITITATTTEQGVNYFTFDLGLSVHTPFGGRR
jgi:opacity protein-like surface antigen